MDRAALAAGAAFVLALSAHFMFETLAGSGTTDAGVVALGAMVAAAVAVLASGLPGVGSLRSLGRREWLELGIAGALAFVAAPTLVLTNRYSAAPSGSESLFFTTAVWAAVLFAVGSAASRAVSWGGAIGSLTALVGSAALLASWEVPSSFSPLVRFTREEVAMSLAALGWAALSLALSRHGRRLGRRTALAACALGGGAAAAGLSLVRWAEVAPALSKWTVVVPLGVALGVMAASWSYLEETVGSARAAGLFGLPAVAITALSGAEHLIVRTPQPMVLGRVTPAAVVTLIGVIAVLAPHREAARPRGRSGTILVVAAGLALCSGVVALAMPSLGADLAGRLETGEAFRASWNLLGAETAGGWLVLSGAAWLLWAVLGGGRAAALSGLGLLATYPWLRDVPLRTWTRWAPAKIQQDYGTEYARLAFSSVPAPAQWAAAGLSATLLVVVAVLYARIAKAHAGAVRDTEVGA